MNIKYSYVGTLLIMAVWLGPFLVFHSQYVLLRVPLQVSHSVSYVSLPRHIREIQGTLNLLSTTPCL